MAPSTPRSTGLEDLDYTRLLESSAGIEPAPRTTRIDDEGLIGERSLASTGYHVAIARARAKAPAGKCHVLVVEDDDDTAALAGRALQNGGYSTSRAAGARETGHLLKTLGLPDLILLDVDLPGLSGFDMLARLRVHPKLSGIPVVMFTARSSKEDVVLGLRLGADGYIAKPVKPKVLLEVVGQVLGR